MKCFINGVGARIFNWGGGGMCTIEEKFLVFF